MGITCKEIAERLGISRQAVYSVLSNKAVCHVSKEKRDRILHLAKAYHYRPNQAAILLNGKPTRTIGYIADRYNGVGGLRLERIATRLHIEGYNLQSVFFSSTMQGYNAFSNFISAGADAVIYPYFLFDFFDQKSIGIPSVNYGNEVAPDYALGMELATKHLIEAHGHTRIIHMTTELLYGAVEKHRGYARAMQQAGLQERPALFSIGNDRFEEMLFAELHDGVSAIVTGGDGFAARLIPYLNRRGIRIPEDVAVTGFDGIGDQPGLTGIVDPVDSTAEKIVELVLDKIRNHTLEELPRSLIAPTLHCSRSCGCPEEVTSNFAYEYTLNGENAK